MITGEGRIHEDIFAFSIDNNEIYMSLGYLPIVCSLLFQACDIHDLEEEEQQEVNFIFHKFKQRKCSNFCPAKSVMLIFIPFYFYAHFIFLAIMIILVLEINYW